MAAALMLQGTGSDVGKSLIVAGLARAFTRRGLAVRPFKPQNMSNNAAVTSDGGEIGRAQALQARACGVAPSVDMNPVLIKPQSETGAQIVVQGRVAGNTRASDYHSLKSQLLSRVMESFARIGGEADLVLVEGAGSPAEINLRANDIANMGFALPARVPVVLVADIDRGGVLASLIGTHSLIEPAERHLLRGYLINKFRGDKTLFDPAVDIIGERTGLTCHGVIPWFPRAVALPAEDAVVLDRCRSRERDERAAAILVAVPRLPHIANFDDLDPLAAEPDVAIDIVEAGRPIPVEADLILLPGSKSTIPDLKYLRDQGWDIDVRAHLRRGRLVLGLCAGYQMLGRRLDDPEGAEGPPGAVDGLGLLEIETVLTGDKRLVEVVGQELSTGEAVHGYEMHIGNTTGPGLKRPMVEIGGKPDGAVSPDGLVMGCYLHGIFAADDFRHAVLARIREGRPQAEAYETGVERTLDALADLLEAHCNLDALLAIARRGV